MKTKAIYIYNIFMVVAVTFGLSSCGARGQEGMPLPTQAPQGYTLSVPPEPNEDVSGFAYDGSLKKNGDPVNDTCQMDFRLYGSSHGLNMVGSPIMTTVSVTNGLFSQELDFGIGAFDGSPRWLEVWVKCTDESSYTSLGRQEIKAFPYALYDLTAPWMRYVP